VPDRFIRDPPTLDADTQATLITRYSDGLLGRNGGDMAYVLRFVQRFRAQDEVAFMALEAQFEPRERRKGWPRGRRSRPFAGREPVHTLVWECEFATLADVDQAVAEMADDPDHGRLLKKQIPFFLEAWTESYERLDFARAPRARRRRAS
jgi:hypothetical protein